MMHMQNDPNAPITSAERAQRSVFGKFIAYFELYIEYYSNLHAWHAMLFKFISVRIFSIHSLSLFCNEYNI